MFENIHFMKAVFTPPMTSSADIQAQLSKTQTSDYADNILFRYNFLGKCVFCIDGEALFCPIRPLSDFAQENLLFVQSFALFRSGPLHFTRRQDTSSYMIIYTYSGKGYMEYDGQIFSLGPGDGLVIDCQKPHFYHTVGNHWEHGVLHFQGNLAGHFYKELCMKGDCFFHQSADGSYQKKLEHLLEYYDGVYPSQELFISNQLEDILLSILSQSDKFKEHIEKIPENLRYLIKYIDNQYTQPLSLDYLADFSGISKYHLCRIFKKYVGMSPMEYIIRLRIENAKQLLETTVLPANKIGAMVGIEDENYFYRLFKSRTGMAPNAWRKKS